jgi:hypothetical protein
MPSDESDRGPRAIPAALAVALNPSERVALELLRACTRAAVRRLAESRAVDLGLCTLLLLLVTDLTQRLRSGTFGPLPPPPPPAPVSATAPSAAGPAWFMTPDMLIGAVGIALMVWTAAAGLGPLSRAAAALEALHVRPGPALDPIPLESRFLREWAASGCEAAGIQLSQEGELDLASLATRLQESAPTQRAVTALDAGLARLRRRLADLLGTRRASGGQVALACALACPDPPAVLWREVLAAALREADRSDVRRDLCLVARLVGGDGIDPGRAAEFLSLPLREAAEILAAHQRLLWRELTRRRNT